MTLLLSGDSKAATIDDIRAIPMPTATRTYQPVSHEQLSNMLAEMAEFEMLEKLGKGDL
ncbi:MAG: hypothetical protein HQ510_07155 [Candidatus Marinimicrobia bacterium]|nr:hypothetical protein [Candidatus Neomarinimicrobiota bacterium]